MTKQKLNLKQKIKMINLDFRFYIFLLYVTFLLHCSCADTSVHGSYSINEINCKEVLLLDCFKSNQMVFYSNSNEVLVPGVGEMLIRGYYDYDFPVLRIYDLEECYFIGEYLIEEFGDDLILSNLDRFHIRINKNKFVNYNSN